MRIELDKSSRKFIKLNRVYPAEVPNLAKQCLIEFKSVMDELNLKWCIFGGTLLGAYRDNDFIYNDDDIDCALIIEDTANLTYSDLKELGATIIEKFDKLGWLRMSFDRNGMNNGFSFYRFNIQFDIDIIKKVDEDKVYEFWYVNRPSRNELRGRPNDYPKRINGKYFNNLEEISFLDIKVSIPSYVEEIFEDYYTDWKNVHLINKEKMMWKRTTTIDDHTDWDYKNNGRTYN